MTTGCPLIPGGWQVSITNTGYILQSQEEHDTIRGPGWWSGKCLSIFCCIEQLHSRTTGLLLFTIPAGQLSSHKSITEETQEEEGYDETEDNPRELLYKEQYACKDRDNKY